MVVWCGGRGWIDWVTYGILESGSRGEPCFFSFFPSGKSAVGIKARGWDGMDAMRCTALIWRCSVLVLANMLKAFWDWSQRGT